MRVLNALCLRNERKLNLGHWRRALGQRGDTLVEVLIAMTVVSLVLTGAYVTTNRSLLDTRAAQERGDALKLSETQLEELKALAATPGNTVFTQTGSFCVYNVTTLEPSTASQCIVNTTGAPAGTQQPAYHLSITEGSSNTFTISNWWYNVDGNTKDQMQLQYRVYPS